MKANLSIFNNYNNELHFIIVVWNGEIKIIKIILDNKTVIKTHYHINVNNCIEKYELSEMTDHGQRKGDSSSVT